MIKTKIAGAVAALALLAAPAAAVAHGDGHHGKSRHHHRHHFKKAQAREVTGTATATVASFTNGELTIALPSGKTFAALVTHRTIITCETAAPQTTATTSRHGDAGDDEDRGDDDANKGDDDNDQGDENGDGRCDASALVAGAKVSEARLSLKGGDATWKKVEILK